MSSTVENQEIVKKVFTSFLEENKSSYAATFANNIIQSLHKKKHLLAYLLNLDVRQVVLNVIK